MKKPVIILTPQNMPMEEPFANIPYNYSNGFNTGRIVRAGGMPVIPAFMEYEDALELMEKCDGLFMTGGADIDPAKYGEEILPCCGTIEYDRDKSDINLMKAALQLKKPILAACRGCQMGNVVLGGTMYQDLPSQTGTTVKHSDYARYGEAVHTVDIVEGSPLHKLTGKAQMGVNALHHQGIKDKAPDIIPMAYAPDGLLEAWYYDKDGRWIRAYQWHPEMMSDADNELIIKDFIDECIARKSK